MSLVRLLDRKGMGLFVDPIAVAQISPSVIPGHSAVALRRAPEAPLTVQGTPDEVHTALFPPKQYDVPAEKQAALKEALRAQGGGGVFQPLHVLDPGIITPEQAVETLEQGVEHGGLTAATWERLGRLLRHTSPAALEEALNPATYEAEWGLYTPEQTRAMQNALTLVRVRLGVEGR